MVQLRVWLGAQFTGLSATATPVPPRITCEPLTAALPVIVSAPLKALSALGENTTLIVQVPAGAKAVPQVPARSPAARLKRGAAVPFEANASVMPVRAAVPVLCKVSVIGSRVVVLFATLPKFSGPPVTLATAAGVPPDPAPNSTAPESTALLVLRALPKKSTFGAGAYVGAVDGTWLTDEPVAV